MRRRNRCRRPELASTTRGTGSRRHSGRRRRPSAPRRCSSRDQCRQVQADRPSLGSRGHLGSQLGGEARPWPRRRSARRRRRRAPGRSTPSSSASPEARSRGRWGCSHDWRQPAVTRQGSPRSPPPHVVTVGRPQLVKVVQHQHERHRAGLNAAARRGAARPSRRRRGRRRRRPGRRAPARCRAYAEANSASSAAGSSSNRSSDTQATGRSSRPPTRQQGRLAVSRGRRDPDDAAATLTSRFDELADG